MPLDKRTIRYHENPAHRKKVRQRARDTYHRTHGVELNDPRKNLAKMDDMGAVRLTNWNNIQTRRWVLNKTEVAELLDTSLKLFYRWINDGRFPKPVITAIDNVKRVRNGKEQVLKQEVGVYTPEEVEAAINVLGPPMSTVRYYRNDHHQTIKAVFLAVAGARRSIGLPDFLNDG